MLGIHGACHLKALSRELAVRITLVHAGLSPVWTQRSKKDDVPMS
jgi:hypothetical protein